MARTTVPTASTFVADANIRTYSFAVRSLADGDLFVYAVTGDSETLVSSSSYTIDTTDTGGTITFNQGYALVDGQQYVVRRSTSVAKRNDYTRQQNVDPDALDSEITWIAGSLQELVNSGDAATANGLAQEILDRIAGDEALQAQIDAGASASPQPLYKFLEQRSLADFELRHVGGNGINVTTNPTSDVTGGVWNFRADNTRNFTEFSLWEDYTIAEGESIDIGDWLDIEFGGSIAFESSANRSLRVERLVSTRAPGETAFSPLFTAGTLEVDAPSGIETTISLSNFDYERRVTRPAASGTTIRTVFRMSIFARRSSLTTPEQILPSGVITFLLSNPSFRTSIFNMEVLGNLVAQTAAWAQRDNTDAIPNDKLPLANTGHRGAMSAAQFDKLAGIEANAQANPSPQDLVNVLNTIRPGWDSNAVETDASITGDGTTGSPLSVANEYTAAEKAKLAGLAVGAEANVNADWNATSGDAQILNKPAETIPEAQVGNDDPLPYDKLANGTPQEGKVPVLQSDNSVLWEEQTGSGGGGGSAVANLSNTTPVRPDDQTGAVGTSDDAARGDHKHPLPADAEIVSAVNRQIGNQAWQGSGGGQIQGITQVEHDSTLEGGGTAVDPLKVADQLKTTIDNSAAAIVDNNDRINAHTGQIQALQARNEFTDADEQKLDGIEDGATADQTGSEIVQAIDSQLGNADWQGSGGGQVTQAVTTDSTIDGDGSTGAPLSVADAVRYSDAKADARVRALVADAAEEGNTDVWGPRKIVATDGSTGDVVARAADGTLEFIAAPTGGGGGSGGGGGGNAYIQLEELVNEANLSATRTTPTSSTSGHCNVFDYTLEAGDIILLELGPEDNTRALSPNYARFSSDDILALRPPTQFGGEYFIDTNSDQDQFVVIPDWRWETQTASTDNNVIALGRTTDNKLLICSGAGGGAHGVADASNTGDFTWGKLYKMYVEAGGGSSITPGDSTPVRPDDDQGNAGASTDYARVDHKHPLPAVATATSDGLLDDEDYNKILGLLGGEVVNLTDNIDQTDLGVMKDTSYDLQPGLILAIQMRSQPTGTTTDPGAARRWHRPWFVRTDDILAKTPLSVGDSTEYNAGEQADILHLVLPGELPLFNTATIGLARTSANRLLISGRNVWRDFDPLKIYEMPAAFGTTGTAGLDQAQVDARVQALVLDQAKVGNNDVWNPRKIVENDGQTGQAVIRAADGSLEFGDVNTDDIDVPQAANAAPPQPDDATGAVGTSDEYAREDHKHPLPALASGTQAGLMSSDLFSKIDNLPGGGTNRGINLVVGDPVFQGDVDFTDELIFIEVDYLLEPGKLLTLNLGNTNENEKLADIQFVPTDRILAQNAGVAGAHAIQGGIFDAVEILKVWYTGDAESHATTHQPIYLGHTADNKLLVAATVTVAGTDIIPLRIYEPYIGFQDVATRISYTTLHTTSIDFTAANRWVGTGFTLEPGKTIALEQGRASAADHRRRGFTETIRTDRLLDLLAQNAGEAVNTALDVLALTGNFFSSGDALLSRDNNNQLLIAASRTTDDILPLAILEARSSAVAEVGTTRLFNQVYSRNLNVTTGNRFVATGWTISDANRFIVNLGTVVAGGSAAGEDHIVKRQRLINLTAAVAGSTADGTNSIVVESAGGVRFNLGRTSANELLFTTASATNDANPLTIEEMAEFVGSVGVTDIDAEDLDGVVEEFAIDGNAVRVQPEKHHENIEALIPNITHEAAVYDDAVEVRLDPTSHIYRTSQVSSDPKGSSTDQRFIQHFSDLYLVILESVYTSNNNFANVTKLIYADREYNATNWRPYTAVRGANGFDADGRKTINGEVFRAYTFDSTDIMNAQDIFVPKFGSRQHTLDVSTTNDVDQTWGTEATPLVRGMVITNVTAEAITGYRAERISATSGNVQQFAISRSRNTMSTSVLGNAATGFWEYDDPAHLGDMALSRDGSTLYMLNAPANKIDAWNLTTNQRDESKDITVGGNARSIMTHPADDVMIVAEAFTNGNIGRFWYSLADDNYGEHLIRTTNNNYSGRGFRRTDRTENAAQVQLINDGVAAGWLVMSWPDSPTDMIGFDAWLGLNTGSLNVLFAEDDTDLGTDDIVYAAYVHGNTMYFAVGTSDTTATKIIGRNFTGAPTLETSARDLLLESDGGERVHWELLKDEVLELDDVVIGDIVKDADADFNEIRDPGFYRIDRNSTYSNAPSFPGSTAALEGTLEVGATEKGGFVSRAQNTSANLINGATDIEDNLYVLSQDVEIGSGTTFAGTVNGQIALRISGIQIPFIYHFVNRGNSGLAIPDTYAHLLPTETTISFTYGGRVYNSVIEKGTTSALVGQTINGDPVSVLYQTNFTTLPDADQINGTADAEIELIGFTIAGDGVESGLDERVAGVEQVYRGYNGAIANRLIQLKGDHWSPTLWTVSTTPLDAEDKLLVNKGLELPTPVFPGDLFSLSHQHNTNAPGLYIASATSTTDPTLRWVNMLGAITGTAVSTSVATSRGRTFPDNPIPGQVHFLEQQSQYPHTSDFRTLTAEQGTHGTDEQYNRIGFRGAPVYTGAEALGSLDPDAGGTDGQNIARITTYTNNNQWGITVYVKTTLLGGTGGYIDTLALTPLNNGPGGFSNSSLILSSWDVTRFTSGASNGYTGFSRITGTQTLVAGHKYLTRVSLRNLTGTVTRPFPVAVAPRGYYIYDGASGMWMPHTP